MASVKEVARHPGTLMIEVIPEPAHVEKFEAKPDALLAIPLMLSIADLIGAVWLWISA